MNSKVKPILLGVLLLLLTNSAAAQRDIPKLPKVSDRYAVIVGVSNYDDKDGIGTLDGADKDARMLRDALSKYAGVPEDQITLLTSDQTGKRKSTSANINAALTNMANVAANGLMIFAFSGHGIYQNGRALLLPSDIIIKDAHPYYDQAITVSSVIEKLSNASQFLLFIDACREGKPEQRFTLGTLQLPTTEVSGIFLGTGNKGFSFVLPKEKMGAFTWVLTQELENATKNKTQLTLGTLKEHLEYRVPPLVKIYNGEQHPYISIGGTGAELLVLAGPPNDPSKMTALPAPQGLTVLRSEDGKEIQVTDHKTGRISVYLRTEPSPSTGPDVTEPVSVRTGEERLTPLSGSTLLIAPNSKIYVADENKGGVIVFDANANQSKPDFINFDLGRPGRMVVAPRRERIYVIDKAKACVGVIDLKTHKFICQYQTGDTPQAIAITPDERKLYIANEQPAPQGTISVIDLDNGQTKTISDVNCPEALAISPDGTFLYVITQCGAGEDPVFVIDTRTDTKIVDKTISGLAVGSSTAIAPSGDKLYVGRVGYYTRDPSTERPLSIPDQISVIDTKTGKLETSRPITAYLFGTTPDGRYVIAGDGPRLHFIDTKTYAITKTLQFDSAPGGVAVTWSKDKTGLLCYVWLPKENRLFFAGLTGILPISRD